MAHHSPAAYDMTAEITVEGTIAEASWRNPHIYITIETAGADGVTRLQEIEAASIASLQPYGLTRDVLAAGRAVSVRGAPGRRPGGDMLGLDLTTEDGTIYRLHPRGRDGALPATAEASGISGQWMPPPSTFLGLQQAVNAAAFTAAAQAARADVEGISESQASCAYFPPPMLMVASYIHTIEVTDEAVIIAIDGVPETRTIHLDGRALDPGAEPAPFGHSVGRWEGETLVIESAGFTPHREGVGFGAPSGPGKRLLERLSLSEDRRQLVYEATVTDPDYLAAPLTYAGTWDYRPDAALSGEPCDEQTAQRFRE